MTVPAWVTDALAKLEGVTPGPWAQRVMGSRLTNDAHPTRWIDSPDRTVAEVIYKADPADLNTAAFIATYDPDTVRRLLELLGEAYKELAIAVQTIEYLNAPSQKVHPEQIAVARRTLKRIEQGLDV